MICQPPLTHNKYHYYFSFSIGNNLPYIYRYLNYLMSDISIQIFEIKIQSN